MDMNNEEGRRQRQESDSERFERARSIYEGEQERGTGQEISRESEPGRERGILGEQEVMFGRVRSDVRNAVVTGGSSGIGKAFAERLGEEGYKVYVFSHDSNYYHKLIQYWEDRENLIPLSGDITDPKSVDKLIHEIETRDGHLDLLINNAAILDEDDGPLPSLEAFRKTIEVDLIGQYHLILKSLPLLRRAEKPIIINISSGSGSLLMIRSSGPLAYRVSKAGLNMLTRSLSFDLKQMNIAIHAVDPGFVDTKLSPGGISPEESIDGMWHLVNLHDTDKSGHFWYHKDVIKC